MNDVDKFELKIMELEVLKDHAIKCADYPLAGKIRDQMDEVKLKKRRLLGDLPLIMAEYAMNVDEAFVKQAERKGEANRENPQLKLKLIEDLLEKKGDDLISAADLDFPRSLPGGCNQGTKTSNAGYSRPHCTNSTNVEENMSLHVREVLLDILEHTKPDAEYLYTRETLAYINWWAHEALDLKPMSITDWIAQSTPRRKHLNRHVLAAEALEKLSGDLSHDNVAAAKQILKRILG